MNYRRSKNILEITSSETETIKMTEIRSKQSIVIIFSITALFVLPFTLPAGAARFAVDKNIYGINGAGLIFNENSVTAGVAELRVYFGGNNSSFLPEFSVALDHTLSYSTNSRMKNLLSPESYSAQNGLYAE